MSQWSGQYMQLCFECPIPLHRLRNSYSFTQGTEEIPLFVRWRPDQSHTAQLTDINFLS